MEMDHGGDAVGCFGQGGGDCWVPGKYVVWREVILPRHVGGDSVESFDCWTRNGCFVFG